MFEGFNINMNIIKKVGRVTFEDLKFKNRDTLGQQATLFFKNGYGVSVVFGEMFYSNGIDTYELAVLIGNESNYDLHYENKVSNGDVVGYLEKEELMKLVNKVGRFKKLIQFNKEKKG